MGPQNVNNNDEELGKIYLMSESNMYPKTTRVKRMLADADRFYGKFDFANARRMLGAVWDQREGPLLQPLNRAKDGR